MFDVHRINRKYSRKTQRNGQIIRSRLKDPPAVIDYNLVPIYRQFLERNPQYLHEPVINAVLQHNPSMNSTLRTPVTPPQLEPSRPIPYLLTYPTADDASTTLLISDIINSNNIDELLPIPNLPDYYATSPVILSHSSGPNYPHRIYYIETDNGYCLCVLPLTTTLRNTSNNAQVYGILSKTIYPEPDNQRYIIYYYDFMSHHPLPNITLYAQDDPALPRNLPILSFTAPVVDIAPSDITEANAYISFTQLSKPTFG